MNTDSAVFVLAEMLETAALVGAPILFVMLIVGLVISIFQVVTQIQEMTLTFVPKLAAAVIALLILGRWMLINLVEYTQGQLAGIATM